MTAHRQQLNLKLGAMTLLALLASVFPLAGERPDQSAGAQAGVQFEARLVSEEPVDGWLPCEAPDGHTIYLSPEAALTNNDIEEAWLEPGGKAPSIGLYLSEDGALALAKLTRANIGRKLALMLDGEVVSAPIIRAPITAGRAMITGNFSEDEARTIAENLDPR